MKKDSIQVKEQKGKSRKKRKKIFFYVQQASVSLDIVIVMSE